MREKKRSAGLLAAPLIAAVILLIVYAVKGIYPFGEGTVLGGDLYQLGVPNFMHTVDAWHSGTLFYDLTTAGGSARNELTAILRPTTWFILLVGKNRLVQALPFLVMIKLSVIALSAAFVFSKLFPRLSLPWYCLLSLVYTFSGYDLQYYTNIDWLDCVALYPLLIYALLRMFRGKSKLPYILLLTYLLCVQTYMSYFVVVSLIVFGGIYIFTAVEKEQRRRYIYALGSGTVIALLASAYRVYEYFGANFGTARFVEYGAEQSGNGLSDALAGIITKGLYYDMVDAMMLLGTELALACIIWMFFNFKVLKNQRQDYVSFFSASFLLLWFQMHCQGTELFWHGGSRVMFPFRNGYMLSLLACLIIGYCFSNQSLFEARLTAKEQRMQYVFPVAAIVLTAAAVICSGKFYALFRVYDVVGKTTVLNRYYDAFTVLFVITVLAYFCVLMMKKRRVKQGVIFVAVIGLIAVNTFSIVGYAEGTKKAEGYNQYYEDCFETASLYPEKDALERVANPDISLITNYAYFGNFSTVSNWVNNLSLQQMNAFSALGFSTIYTRTTDAGGTAFSSALLRVTDSVSKAALNPNLYLQQKAQNGLTAYKNRFTLPVGLPFASSLKGIHYADYENTFEYQNAIYEALGGEGRLFERAELMQNSSRQVERAAYNAVGVPSSETEKEPVTLVEAELTTTGNSTLYLRLNKKNVKLFQLYINGERQLFSKQAEGTLRDSNPVFPAGFSGNLAELGSFDGETLQISADIYNGSLADIDFYLMDNGKLNRLCSMMPDNDYSVVKDTVTFSCNADGGEWLFVPVAYSEDWQCTVNGEAVEAVSVLGNFIALPASQGKNEVQLSYSHKKGVLTFLMIAAAFGIAFALAFLERRLKADNPRLLNFTYWAFVLLFGGVMVLFYVFPFIGCFLG